MVCCMTHFDRRIDQRQRAPANAVDVTQVLFEYGSDAVVHTISSLCGDS